MDIKKILKTSLFVVLVILCVSYTFMVVEDIYDKKELEASYEIILEQKENEILDLEKDYEIMYDANKAKEERIEELETELEELKETYNNN